MTESLLSVQLDRWLFTVVLSFAAVSFVVGVAAGLWLFAVRRRPLLSVLPFVTLSLGGLAAGFWVIVATIERNGWWTAFAPGADRLSIGGFDLNRYLDEVRPALVYVTGGAAAALVVLIAAAGLMRLSPVVARGGIRAALGALLPLFILAILMMSLLHSISNLTAANVIGQHPRNVVIAQSQEVTLLGTGASFITGLAVAPTGEIFFTEHLTGRIGVMVPGTDGSYHQATFALVEKPEEARLLHIELHPNWPDQPFVYVTVQHDVDDVRYLAVTRLRSEGLVASEQVRVVEGLPTTDPADMNSDHFGSAIIACGEYLFVSVGDTDLPLPGSNFPGEVGFRAQLPIAGEGKILRYRFEGERLLPDGVIGDALPIFAMGFRNVFSMSCDPTGDRLFAYDNGPNGQDQVRLVEPGSNHEWPLSDTRRRLTPPIYTSGRTQLGATAIAVRPASQGAEVVFGGFNTRALYRFVFDAGTQTAGTVELFHQLADAPLALAVDDAGCVIVADATSIWRIQDAQCARSAVVTPASLRAEDDPSVSFDPRTYYLSNCAACHGIDREGAIGPSLRPRRLTGSDDSYLATILDGRPGTAMPAWSETGLAAAQAQELLRFLRAGGTSAGTD